jgi:hypothetical protein
MHTAKLPLLVGITNEYDTEDGKTAVQVWDLTSFTDRSKMTEAEAQKWSKARCDAIIRRIHMGCISRSHLHFADGMFVRITKREYPKIKWVEEMRDSLQSKVR